MKLFNKIKKIILNFMMIIGILFFTLIILSIIDVNMHNDPASPNYQNFSDWNLFIPDE